MNDEVISHNLAQLDIKSKVASLSWLILDKTRYGSVSTTFAYTIYDDAQSTLYFRTFHNYNSNANSTPVPDTTTKPIDNNKFLKYDNNMNISQEMGSISINDMFETAFTHGTIHHYNHFSPQLDPRRTLDDEYIDISSARITHIHPISPNIVILGLSIGCIVILSLKMYVASTTAGGIVSQREMLIAGCAHILSLDYASASPCAPLITAISSSPVNFEDDTNASTLLHCVISTKAGVVYVVEYDFPTTNIQHIPFHAINTPNEDKFMNVVSQQFLVDIDFKAASFSLGDFTTFLETDFTSLYIKQLHNAAHKDDLNLMNLAFVTSLSNYIPITSLQLSPSSYLYLTQEGQYHGDVISLDFNIIKHFLSELPFINNINQNYAFYNGNDLGNTKFTPAYVYNNVENVYPLTVMNTATGEILPSSPPFSPTLRFQQFLYVLNQIFPHKFVPNGDIPRASASSIIHKNFIKIYNVNDTNTLIFVYYTTASNIYVYHHNTAQKNSKRSLISPIATFPLTLSSQSSITGEMVENEVLETTETIHLSSFAVITTTENSSSHFNSSFASSYSSGSMGAGSSVAFSNYGEKEPSEHHVILTTTTNHLYNINITQLVYSIAFDGNDHSSRLSRDESDEDDDMLVFNSSTNEEISSVLIGNNIQNDPSTFQYQLLPVYVPVYNEILAEIARCKQLYSIRDPKLEDFHNNIFEPLHNLILFTHNTNLAVLDDGL